MASYSHSLNATGLLPNKILIWEHQITKIIKCFKKSMAKIGLNAGLHLLTLLKLWTSLLQLGAVFIGKPEGLDLYFLISTADKHSQKSTCWQKEVSNSFMDGCLWYILLSWSELTIGPEKDFQPINNRAIGAKKVEQCISKISPPFSPSLSIPYILWHISSY